MDETISKCRVVLTSMIPMQYFPRQDNAACLPVAGKMISYCDSGDLYCDNVRGPVPFFLPPPPFHPGVMSVEDSLISSPTTLCNGCPIFKLLT